MTTMTQGGRSYLWNSRDRDRRGEANFHAREIGMGGIRGVRPTKHGKLPCPYATNSGPEVS